jgi:hypothetical protein
MHENAKLRRCKERVKMQSPCPVCPASTLYICAAPSDTRVKNIRPAVHAPSPMFQQLVARAGAGVWPDRPGDMALAVSGKGDLPSTGHELRASRCRGLNYARRRGERRDGDGIVRPAWGA